MKNYNLTKELKSSTNPELNLQSSLYSEIFNNILFLFLLLLLPVVAFSQTGENAVHCKWDKDEIIVPGQGNYSHLQVSRINPVSDNLWTSAKYSSQPKTDFFEMIDGIHVNRGTISDAEVWDMEILDNGDIYALATKGQVFTDIYNEAKIYKYFAPNFWVPVFDIPLGGLKAHSDLMAFGGNGSELCVAVAKGDVYSSTSYTTLLYCLQGGSWVPLSNAGLPTANSAYDNSFEFSISPTGVKYLSVGNVLYKFDGSTWQQEVTGCGDYDQNALSITNSLAFTSDNKAIMSTGCGDIKYNIFGSTWVDIVFPINEKIYDIAIKDDIMYVSAGATVYVKPVNGGTWEPVTPARSLNSEFRKKISFSDAGELFVNSEKLVCREYCCNGIDDDFDGQTDEDCDAAINGGAVDFDGDGVSAECDIDDDNDGILDWNECGIAKFTGFGQTSYEGTFDYDDVKVTISGLSGSTHTTGSSPDYAFNNNLPVISSGQFIKENNAADGNIHNIKFDQTVPGFFLAIRQYKPGFQHTGEIIFDKPFKHIDGMATKVGNKMVGSQPYFLVYFEGPLDEVNVELDWPQIVPTSNTGMHYSIYLDCDTDGDGIVNRLDNDSDGDGCPDASEAGHDAPVTTTTPIRVSGNVGNNGLANSLETQPDNNAINYTQANNFVSLGDCVEICCNGIDDNGNGQTDEGCATSDFDGDGIADDCDWDSDNDGIPNSIEGCGPWEVYVAYTSHSNRSAMVEIKVDGAATTTATINQKTGITIGEGQGIQYGGVNWDLISNYVLPDANNKLVVTVDDSASDGVTLIDGILLRRNGTVIVLDEYPQVNTQPFGTMTTQQIGNWTQDGNGSYYGGTVRFTFPGNGSKKLIFTYEGIPCDFDNDGMPNYLDLDSDANGCPDAQDAGHDFPGAFPLQQVTGNMGANGLLDDLETTPDNGVLNYTIATTNGTYKFLANGNCENPNIQPERCCNGIDDDFDGLIDEADSDCVDTDGDGIMDHCDADSDNDGILDIDECRLRFDKTDRIYDYDLHFFSGSDGVIGNAFDNDLSTSIITNTSGTNNNILIDFPTYVGSSVTNDNGAFEEVRGLVLTNISEDDAYNYFLNVEDNLAEAQICFTTNPDYESNEDILITTQDLKLTPSSPDTCIMLNNVFANSNRVYLTVEELFNNGRITFPAVQIYIQDLRDNSPIGLAEFELIACVDWDNDGIPNHLDLDSDGDGCPDALEAGHGLPYDPNTLMLQNINVGNNGAHSGIELDDTYKTLSNYALAQTPFEASFRDAANCPEICCNGIDDDFDGLVDDADTDSNCGFETGDNDGDGILDYCDLDDDNDGIPDTLECGFENAMFTLNQQGTTYTTSGYTSTRTGTTASGTSVTVENVTFTRGDRVEISLKEASTLITFNPPVTDPELIISDLKPNGGNHYAGDVGFDKPFRVISTTGNYNPVTKRIYGTESVTRAKFYGQITTIELIGSQTHATTADIGFYIPVCDSDNDGIPNYFDTDSDGDGCPDVYEAGHNQPFDSTTFTIIGNLGNNGLADAIETSDDLDGKINYTLTTTTDTLSFLDPNDCIEICFNNIDDDFDGEIDEADTCADSDGDGIPDINDLDDDNDGIPDYEECPNLVSQGPFSVYTTWSANSYRPTKTFYSIDNTNINVAINQQTPPGADHSYQSTNDFGWRLIASGVTKDNNNQIVVRHTEQNGAPKYQFKKMWNQSMLLVSEEDGSIIFIDVTSPKYSEIGSGWSGGDLQGKAYRVNVINDNIGTGVWTFDIPDSGTVCDDNDGDGIPNNLDLDSDGDGCLDALEAGHGIPTQPDSTITGPYGVNGLADAVEVTTDNGQVNYSLTAASDDPTIPSYLYNGDCIEICCNGIDDNGDGQIDENCTDSDSDGIQDVCDLDDDNDGIPDNLECPEMQATIVGGQISKQFSTYSVDLAYDGNPGSFAIAGNRIHDWIDFDLGTIQTVSSIVIDPGGRGSGLTDARLFAADTPFPPSFTEIAPASANADFEFKFGDLNGVTAEQVITINPPVLARYIRVQVDKPASVINRWLYIPEIKIMVVEDCDTDGDGTPNRLDLDSDGDTCFDALESGHGHPIDANGVIMANPTDFGTNGLFSGVETNDAFDAAINYTLDNTNDISNAILSTSSSACSTNIDYGDLPLGYGAPSHEWDSNVDAAGIPQGTDRVWLGSILDFDNTGFDTPDARGDNDDNLDDEDGLINFPTEVEDGQSITLDLTLNSSVPTTVHYGVWVDYDNDGTWDEFVNGQGSTSSPLVVNPQINIPANFSSEKIIVRVRADVAPFTMADNTGSRNNGEVEDYVFDVCNFELTASMTQGCTQESLPAITANKAGGVWSVTSSIGTTVDQSGVVTLGMNTTPNPIMEPVIYTAGCADTVMVTIYPKPIATATNGGDVCQGSSVSLMATGGASYSWSGPNGYTSTMQNPTITNVLGGVSGTYMVTVMDANGCTATATTDVTVNPPVLLTATPTSPTCNAGADGSYMVNITQGTGLFSYNDGSGMVTGQGQNFTVNNKAAGNYTITVTDANGCTGMTTVNITNPPAATVNATATDPVCLGQKGSISLDNGVSYVISPISPGTFGFGNGQTISNQNPGTYSITVTDANGCTAITSATINAATAVVATTANVTDPTCNGENTGTVDLLVNTNTVVSYKYNSGSGDVNGIGSSLQNLSAGTYNVTVTDGNGCTGVTSFTLNDPALMTASSSKTDVSSVGASDGDYTITLMNGTPNYSYDDGTNSGANVTSPITVSNLGAGTYSVTITDANGCSIVEAITISDPSCNIVMTATPTATTCNGGADGEVLIASNNWITPINYTVTGTANQTGTGTTISGLSAGAYNIAIVDAAGCTATQNVNITEPAQITLSAAVNAADCNGASTGSVDITTSGAMPISYSYSGVATGNGSGTTIPNLAAGSYDLMITDANGCTASITGITMTEPAALVAMAGPDQQVCDLSADLAANTPTLGMGAWSQISGPGTSNFANNNVNNTSVIPSIAGTYEYEWKVTYNACPMATDIVQITFDEVPVPNAGMDQTGANEVCGYVTNMNADALTVGTGMWTLTSGPASLAIADDTSPTTMVTGTVAGSYVMKWTVTNGVCPPEESTVLVDLTVCDRDGDGVLDDVDVDDDNDGILDSDEMIGGNDRDTDGDGVPDRLDADSDNDGITDAQEAYQTSGTHADPDNDGFLNTIGGGNIAVNADGSLQMTYLTPINTDGDLYPNHIDVDSDGDGLPDTYEGNFQVPDGDNDGHVGTGPFMDSDGDGLADSNDPDNPSNILGGFGFNKDRDLDGVPNYLDIDIDNDGIVDNIEGQTSFGYLPPLGADTDMDGLDDQYDVDNGGVGIGYTNTDGGSAPDYADTDSDNDGIPDLQENFYEHNCAGGTESDIPEPGTAANDKYLNLAAAANDADGDGLADIFDMVSGATMATNATNGQSPLSMPDCTAGGDKDYRDAGDNDGDGIPDGLDPDDDNDGIPDIVEGNLDTDGDGSVDSQDLDSDGDGIPDVIEAGGDDPDGDGHPGTTSVGTRTPIDANGTPLVGGSPVVLTPIDTDGDGINDYKDLDSDNDGITDAIEGGGTDSNGDGIQGPGQENDSDSDGLADSVDPIDDRDFSADGGTPLPIPNTDGTTAVDYLDLDSDDDGILDIVEAGGMDPDNDGMIGTGTGTAFPDTDMDGLGDIVDNIDNTLNNSQPQTGTPLTEVDTDNDGIPDFRDIDSDNDGVVDIIEAQASDNFVAPAATGDSDGDGINDAYDPTNGFGGVGAGLTPFNTDTDTTPDYQDTDSDDDGKSDLLEANPGTVLTNADADGDGLDNVFDMDGLSTTNTSVTNGQLATDFPNVDLPGTAELDWRESGKDSDGDGIDDTADQCPNSIAGATVNAQGCTDQDGDGYFPDAPMDSSFFDPDDTEACIPDPSVAACVPIDVDGDGYSPNFPPTHAQYDPDDADPCIPDNTVGACDQDGDGVPDGLDNCPFSLAGANVNAQGCTDEDMDGYFPDANPATPQYDEDDTNPCVPDNTVAQCDTDNDGVPDSQDSCPFSAPNAVVTAAGCTDVDGDGYFPDINPSNTAFDPDDNEACIPEPSEALCIPVDNDGDGYFENYPPTHAQYDPNDTEPCIPDNTVAQCDEDMDGIPDGNDKCFGTPTGVAVNGDGCSDEDMDGFFPLNDPNDPMYDPNDQMPCIPSDTAAACDADGDGVPDGNDSCPTSLAGAVVNAQGCTDFDMDGFYPDAPVGPAFDPDDANPCVPDNTKLLCDTDGDGVPDGNDNCPNSAPGANLLTGFNAMTGCTDVDGDGFFPDAPPTDSTFDPEDDNPCVPDATANACILTDLDGDGYFPELPNTNPLHDPDDTDPCIPDNTVAACDSDGDGVQNSLDLCPNTIAGATVNADGCMDADMDGFFPDAPTTDPTYDPNDADPCIPDDTDTDGDGFCDVEENIMNSDINDPCDPDNTVGQCDTDNDGIPDGIDMCPFSAPNALVNAMGCTDVDGDGYYPDIPDTDAQYDPDDVDPCVPEISSTVCIPIDNDGDGFYPNYPPTHPQYDPDDTNPCIPDNTVAQCDTDNDGIPDGSDACPFSLAGATVNGDGCTDVDGDGFFPDAPPTDSTYDPQDDNPCIPDASNLTCDTDGDGVPDVNDSCPNSPAGAIVNGAGCRDIDMDGYFPGLPPDSPNYDPNDLEPCIPEITSVDCIPIDADGDGYVSNYPPTHPQYDPEDTNPCIPDVTVTVCDADGDGVPNDIDQCPNSPAGVKDLAGFNIITGCYDGDGDGFSPGATGINFDPDDTNPCIPSNTNILCDADGDGVPDGVDECPNSPAGVKDMTGFDAVTGCFDGDGDGYFPGAVDGSNDPDDTDVCVPNVLALPQSDCDMDGNPNASDPNPTDPIAEDDSFVAVDGTLTVFDILDNDDFLPSEEIGIYNIGGTAQGDIQFNNAMGQMEYIPVIDEANSVVTVIYNVCNELVTPSVCDTATVTITVPQCPSSIDSDGDGLTDCEETTGIDDIRTVVVPVGNSDPNNPCDPNVNAVPAFDCDGDGNPNGLDPNVGNPVAENDGVIAYVEQEIVYNILENDDFIPGPNTTITQEGVHTGAGTVSFDPLTGEMSYTPTLDDENSTIIIGYEVCNTNVSPVVCAQAQIDIFIPQCPSPRDTDGDGIPDCIELDNNSSPFDPCDPNPLAVASGDCDGDGNPNSTDPNPTSPVVAPDLMNAVVGQSSTINILLNDDFLPGPLTTIEQADAVNTAQGQVYFSSNNGEFTYIALPEEAGMTVQTSYEVCYTDIDNNKVCNLAIISIVVPLCPSIIDTDGDGLTDCEEMNGVDDPSTLAVPSGISDPNDPCDPLVTALANGDCDGDGNPNGTDPNPALPTANNDQFDAISDLPGVFNILTNDDFLPGPNTTITNTGNGTAGGTIQFDPLTGELTYTGLPSEEGIPVSIQYEVCNTSVNPVVCATAIVVVNVMDNCPNPIDTDGDGLTDCEEETGIDDPITPNAVPNGTSDPLNPCDPAPTVATDDCDGDGNPNGTDPNPSEGVAVDDNAIVKVDIPVGINILSNDDFLPGPNTTITNTGNGTAGGTVEFDPLTGQLTYTGLPSEENATVTIEYEVCNTAVTPNVCDVAMVTLLVTKDRDPDLFPNFTFSNTTFIVGEQKMIIANINEIEDEATNGVKEFFIPFSQGFTYEFVPTMTTTTISGIPETVNNDDWDVTNTGFGLKFVSKSGKEIAAGSRSRVAIRVTADVVGTEANFTVNITPGSGSETKAFNNVAVLSMSIAH